MACRLEIPVCITHSGFDSSYHSLDLSNASASGLAYGLALCSASSLSYGLAFLPNVVVFGPSIPDRFLALFKHPSQIFNQSHRPHRPTASIIPLLFDCIISKSSSQVALNSRIQSFTGLSPVSCFRKVILLYSESPCYS